MYITSVYAAVRTYLYHTQVNSRSIQQLVKQCKAVTVGLTKDSKPQKVTT